VRYLFQTVFSSHSQPPSVTIYRATQEYNMAAEPKEEDCKSIDKQCTGKGLSLAVPVVDDHEEDEDDEDFEVRSTLRYMHCGTCISSTLY
jgi:hypothetical protein